MSDYNDGILPEPCLRMDTHFGDEYESIEFGDGTGYIKAAPILAKVGALHEEIDMLREHVKMPDEPLEIDEKDFYVRAFIKWATEEQPAVKRLEAENAKLRELMYKVEHYEQYGCYECPHSSICDVGTIFDDCTMSHEIESEKHELGIEMDA